MWGLPGPWTELVSPALEEESNDSLPLSHEGSLVDLILTNQLIKAKDNF